MRLPLHPNVNNVNVSESFAFVNTFNNSKQTPNAAKCISEINIPRSLPNPDCLKPPNGAATSVLLYVLTKHVPASSLSATFRA